MGQAISDFSEHVYTTLFGKMEARIVMIGLDAAGKTSILFKLRTGEVVTTIPTIGFNVDSVEHKGVNFTMWDIGGQDLIDRQWRRHYNSADAIIFVVDSADAGRLGTARDELHKLLSEDGFASAKVLVFANKQDMPNALSVSAVTEGLDLRAARRTQEWYVRGCSATRGGQGLYEGLDWLASAIKRGKP